MKDPEEKELTSLRAEKLTMEFHLELIKNEINGHQKKILDLDKIAERKFARLQEIAEQMDSIQFNTTGE